MPAGRIDRDLVHDAECGGLDGGSGLQRVVFHEVGRQFGLRWPAALPPHRPPLPSVPRPPPAGRLERLRHPARRWPAEPLGSGRPACARELRTPRRCGRRMSLPSPRAPPIGHDARAERPWSPTPEPRCPGLVSARWPLLWCEWIRWTERAGLQRWRSARRPHSWRRPRHARARGSAQGESARRTPMRRRSPTWREKARAQARGGDAAAVRPNPVAVRHPLHRGPRPASDDEAVHPESGTSIEGNPECFRSI